MYRGSTTLTLLCVLALLLGGSACSKDNSQIDELQQARQAALAEIESAKAALDAKRGELADLRETIANPDGASEGEASEGEEQPADPEALQAQADSLKAEIDGQADELNKLIANFINEDPPIAGEPLNETMQKAVDIKVDEDILLAREYIEMGGDHRKAISILEQILPLAKDNPRLVEELEKANADRWMTEERFAAVKEGMSEQEVRDTLGQVNLRNLKEYPDRGVTAWFYLKEDGGAAAVYFRKKRDQLVVYKADFNAVKKESDEEEAA